MRCRRSVREYVEKGHPDRLRALTPRHINAPADYWPQKVLAVSSVNAAMQNYVNMHEHQTRPNPALAVVHGQAALLLRYDVPTYYVSREILAAALRTELPDDMFFEAIPFPFAALVFMLPKGTVRHPTEGDCPFLVLSRTSKGQTLSLPIPELDFNVTAEQGAVDVTTYMQDAEFNIIWSHVQESKRKKRLTTKRYDWNKNPFFQSFHEKPFLPLMSVAKLAIANTAHAGSVRWHIYPHNSML